MIHEKTEIRLRPSLKPKKIKIGTILDEQIVQRLKERAIKEGRTISAVIEDAVMQYEQHDPLSMMVRRKAFDTYCATRFSISKTDWNDIMEEDIFDQ